MLIEAKNMDNSLLKEKRLALGLTLEEVGNYCGVGKSTVRKWETGIIKNMKRNQISKLSEILQVSPLELIGYNSDTLTPIPIDNLVFDDYFPLPYCSNLSAGSFEELLENDPDCVVYVPIIFQNKKKHLHAFKVNGTSMNNVIPDGSIVVCEDNYNNGIQYKNGTIVVAFLDGEATVKRFYKNADNVTLAPDSENKSYTPIIIHDDKQLYIIGRVIWFMNPDDIAKKWY